MNILETLRKLDGYGLAIADEKEIVERLVNDYEIDSEDVFGKGDVKNVDTPFMELVRGLSAFGVILVDEERVEGKLVDLNFTEKEITGEDE